MVEWLSPSHEKLNKYISGGCCVVISHSAKTTSYLLKVYQYTKFLPPQKFYRHRVDIIDDRQLKNT